VERCTEDYYTDEPSKQCLPCDQQCLGCHGPTVADCTACRYIKLYNELEDRSSPDSPVRDDADGFDMS